jgi:hypothetical protein
MVFVGDEDPVEFGVFLADGGQAGDRFLAAEAGVDQDARPPAGDEDAIAGG